MSEENSIFIRRLQYRLQRQGMLELDAWLAPLLTALASGNPEVNRAIESLVRCEVPELLAMQAGLIEIPQELQPWLNT